MDTKLYWAKTIGTDLYVVQAIPGNKIALTHPSVDNAINAAKADWDYVDSTTSGEFYKHHTLVECPEGMALTEEPNCFYH